MHHYVDQVSPAENSDLPKVFCFRFLFVKPEAGQNIALLVLPIASISAVVLSILLGSFHFISP